MKMAGYPLPPMADRRNNDGSLLFRLSHSTHFSLSRDDDVMGDGSCRDSDRWMCRGCRAICNAFATQKQKNI